MGRRGGAWFPAEDDANDGHSEDDGDDDNDENDDVVAITAMTFGSQKILWLLVLLIPTLWIMRFAWARASRRMKAFGAVGLAPRDALRKKIRRERVMILAAMAAIMVALAGPRGGFDEVEIQSSGSDIFVAMDLSNSMLASDVRPSRFDRARREVFDLLDHVATSGRSDRVGLIGFAGVSFVQCPLTSDTAALREYLMLMNPADMPVQGTDVGGAITTALAAMDAGGVGPDVAATRAIILISDGEDLAGEAAAAVKEAKARGVRIFTVGVGTAEGAPIPDARGGGLKKDRRGNVIVSHFVGKSLREIAEDTGGEYVELGSGGRIQNLDFVTVLGEAVHESGKVKLWHEKFQWPLAVAAGALVSLIVIGGYAPGVVVGLVFMSFLLQPVLLPARAEAAENSTADFFSRAQRERLQTYNDGIDAHERGDFEKARELFKKAAGGDAVKSPSDGEVSARSLYNEGNAAVGAGDLDGAEKSYEEALKLAPDDKEAAENLTWVKEQKKQQQKNQNQQQDDGKDKPNDKPNDKGNEKKDQSNGQAKDNVNDKASDKANDDKKPGGEQDKGQNKAQDKSQAGQKPADEKRALTREEAERMLNSVDDVKSKYLYFVLPKDQREKAATPPEKDW